MEKIDKGKITEECGSQKQEMRNDSYAKFLHKFALIFQVKIQAQYLNLPVAQLYVNAYGL